MRGRSWESGKTYGEWLDVRHLQTLLLKCWNSLSIYKAQTELVEVTGPSWVQDDVTAGRLLFG